MPTRVPTLLAIDAGNTRIKFGLFDQQPAGPLPACRAHGHIPCGAAWPEPVWKRKFAVPGIEAVISGSNPPEIARLAADWQTDWPRLTVFADRDRLPLRIVVDEPEKVGLDRLFNAVAAQRLRRARQSVVIIDSGTATTVDYVDEQGAFCGGAILPGIGMSARALHHYTALLPLIPARDVTAAAPEVVGRNTGDAMKSGLFWGHIGAVRELAGQMASRGAGQDEPLILLTGGAGEALRPYFAGARSEPFLPLQGLVLCELARRA